MSICLPKDIADGFLRRLKDGRINFEKFFSMTSEQRRAVFEEFMLPEEAKKTNATIEAALTRKNWERAVINTVKSLTGLKEEVRRDILKRVERIDEQLNPGSIELFFEDFVEKKLGAQVTIEEAKNLSELGKRVALAEANIGPRSKYGEKVTEKELEYGRAVVAFSNYFVELSQPPLTIGGLAKQTVTKPFEFIKNVAGIAKSVKASFDMSAAFSQGLKTLLSYPPRIWFDSVLTGFKTALKSFTNKEVMDEFNARIAARPRYKQYMRSDQKLPVFTVEEAFPSGSIPSRIPLFGKLYRASEVGFTSTLHQLRADMFDYLADKIEKVPGGDIKGLGLFVGDLTGRSHLGKYETLATTVNKLFFSPRKVISNINTFLRPFDNSGRLSIEVRNEAFTSMIRTIGGIAAILAVAKLIQPNSVEEDPRSADFGKIRINDTRFDVTGGISQFATLAMRLLTLSSKSSTTGEVKKLNTGEYGGQTGIDVFVNFAQNKLSPAASVVKDLLLGKDFQGNKPTFTGEMKNLFAPLPFTTFEELNKNPNSANILLSQIADMLGIYANTYSPTSNWSTTTSKELLAFKSKVGDEKFKEANNKFNEEFNQWFNKIKNDPRYLNLTTDQKNTVVNKKKDDIKESIMRKYGFVYIKQQSRPLPKL
jgi:hypothetical protein